MLEFLSQHNQVINTLANIGMLFVWVFYLQVFITNYRRRVRPKILINRGAGSGWDARCLVCNMSGEPIYIQSVLVTVDVGGESHTCPVTDPDNEERWQGPSDVNLWTRQGPLDAAKVRDMGTFRALVDHSIRFRRGEPYVSSLEELDAFLITVVASHGSDDVPAGAERRFTVVRRHGAVVLRPASGQAEQIRSRRQRRKIAKILQADD